MSKMPKYPGGTCEFCGAKFERPHKHRTETEGFHIKCCHVASIKEAMKEKLDEGTKLMYIDELNSLSHKFSFGGHEKKYYDKMLEIKKMIQELEQ